MNGRVTMNISNDRNPETFEVGLSAPCITLGLNEFYTGKMMLTASKIALTKSQ
jgi:hypothetical protein